MLIVFLRACTCMDMRFEGRCCFNPGYGFADWCIVSTYRSAKTQVRKTARPTRDDRPCRHLSSLARARHQAATTGNQKASYNRQTGKRESIFSLRRFPLPSTFHNKPLSTDHTAAQADPENPAASSSGNHTPHFHAYSASSCAT